MSVPPCLAIRLREGKKVFFASDFHLGVPNAEASLARERRIVRWLNRIAPDAQTIFLVGDIFDFWFEYRRAVPRGFLRLQGKLAELTDGGTQVVFFTGNHDAWMFDYFTNELGIVVHHQPQCYRINDARFYIGHGDGLGPGDHSFKLLKRVFASPAAQWMFAGLHPNVGIGLATKWSAKSRLRNQARDETFKGEDEWLWVYCREMEIRQHHDYYVFGHRHLPLDLPVGTTSRYLNLGEWVNFSTYACFDGQRMCLTEFADNEPA